MPFFLTFVLCTSIIVGYHATDKADPGMFVVDCVFRPKFSTAFCCAHPTRHRSPASLALAKWVSQQRAQQAQGRLAADRKAKLDAIDFSWKLNTVKNRNTKTEDKKWMRQYEKLIAFHQEHGHCKAS